MYSIINLLYAYLDKVAFEIGCCDKLASLRHVVPKGLFLLGLYNK